VANRRTRKQNLHSLYLKLSSRYFSFQYVTFRSRNAAGNVNCPLAVVPPSAETKHGTDGANFTAEALKRVESMTTVWRFLSPATPKHKRLRWSRGAGLLI